jgi:uncharacterized membrane protein YesL
MNPFRIVWSAAVDLYDNLFPLVGMNLLWVALSVPVVLVLTAILLLPGLPSDLAFSIALLAAVVAPSPASVGIHLYANQLIKGERADFDLFWLGLRTFWARSLALLAIGFLGAVLLGVNIYFYVSNESMALRYFAILWVYALIIWVMMLLYMNPLLVEQENKSLKLVLRNALYLCLGNLIPSFVILVIILAATVLSIGVTLLVALVGGAFVAIVETRAVLAFLERYRERAAKSAS